MQYQCERPPGPTVWCTYATSVCDCADVNYRMAKIKEKKRWIDRQNIWRTFIIWMFVSIEMSCYGFDPIPCVPDPVNVSETDGVRCGSSSRVRVCDCTLTFRSLLWRCDVFGLANSNSSVFLSVVRMAEFSFLFRFVSAYFCTIDVIELYLFSYVGTKDGVGRVCLTLSLPSLFFYDFPLVVGCFVFIPKH